MVWLLAVCNTDGYHLSHEGTKVFNCNLRCTIELVLNIRSHARYSEKVNMSDNTHWYPLIISFGNWNIDGLHSRIGGIRTSKLTFAPIINSLQNVDIFCLSETHCESSDVINVEGYHVVQRFRPWSLRTPHAFGGLAVGIKINLLKGVKFLPSKTSEFMWFKLCKSFFWPKKRSLCM